MDKNLRAQQLIGQIINCGFKTKTVFDTFKTVKNLESY